MSFEKHELKHLLRELKEIFATKKDLEELDVNVDIDWDSIDVAYVGEEEPENENAIWFDSGEDNVNEITYDNPVVNEIFACIRTLQDQVKKLQEDVEYLKLYGGGGSSGGGTDEPEETTVSSLALETGGMFLLEDGGLLILENAIETITESILLLENGAQFLLENGANIKLEK
jgi:hypothetical protein